jgi:hypothetical protein
LSISDEISALNKLVQRGKGSVDICLTEDGNVGVFWNGREGCSIGGESIQDALSGRYFQNELLRKGR